MDMPSKRRTVAAQAAEMGPLPQMPAELIEQLVQGPMSPSEVQTLFLSFKKAVIERAMNAEMNQHLGYRSGEVKPDGQGNERNGASGKTAASIDFDHFSASLRLEKVFDCEGLPFTRTCARYETSFVSGETSL
jgi:hypothetical protein